MAKKRINPFDTPFGNSGQEKDNDMFDGFQMAGVDMKTMAPLLASLTDQEGMMLFTMLAHAVESGVTPEMYASFHKAYEHLRPMLVEHTHARRPGRSRKKNTAQGNPEKTLLLKIQMKGVTKPPMWREVELPADRSFLDLHEVIQCVVGLENYHLWQFNEKAYDDEVQIGTESPDEYTPGLEFVTDVAADTPVITYLGEEGEKLEYVYDFGDDWIFTVTVKKVLEKKSEHPVCTAFKSDLNAIEDTGGPWDYERIRQDYADWSTYTKKRRQEIAEDWGFESAEEYYEMLKSSVFDIDSVNEELRDF